MIHIIWTAAFCMNEGSVENIIFASYPYTPQGPVLCKDNAPIQHFFAYDLDHPDVLFDAKRSIQYDCFCKWQNHPDGLAFPKSTVWSKI